LGFWALGPGAGGGEWDLDCEKKENKRMGFE